MKDGGTTIRDHPKHGRACMLVATCVLFSQRQHDRKPIFLLPGLSTLPLVRTENILSMTVRKPICWLSEIIKLPTLCTEHILSVNILAQVSSVYALAMFAGTRFLARGLSCQHWAAAFSFWTTSAPGAELAEAGRSCAEQGLRCAELSWAELS